MNLILEEKEFPLWLVPRASVSDKRLQHLRDMNQQLRIELEPSGELYINVKPIAASPQR
jgi:hypothetical protein